MTQPEREEKAKSLLVLFDTVFWALNHGTFKDKTERSQLVEALRNVIASFDSAYNHEPYKKINDVWTHSGSFQYHAIANNCANKRRSYLVVLRGQMIIVSEDTYLLKQGQVLRLEPNEVRSGLVHADSRIMRVFVNTEEELKTFLEAL